MTTIALAVFLAALDQTVVATALPTIARDLHGLAGLPMVVTAYLVAACVATPIAGKFGDLFGRRPVFLCAVILFAVGSLVGGVAQQMPVMFTGRAIQGAGAGAVMTLALTIVAESFPSGQRAKYQGFLGSLFGLASIVGPMIGGVVTEGTSWRYLFLANVPLCVAICIGAAVTMQPGELRTGSRLDFPGIAILSAALVCAILTLEWGGSRQPWDSPLIITMACATAAMTVAFVTVELRVRNPFVPLRLLRDPGFRAPVVVGAATAMSLFVAVTFLPLLCQQALSTGATVSGLLLAPFMAAVVVTSSVAGSLASRWNSYRFFPLSGTILAAVGMVSFATISTGAAYYRIIASMVVFGCGIGMIMQLIVLAAQDRLPKEDLGVGTSLVMVARSIGAIAGVAVFGNLFATVQVQRPDADLATPLRILFAWAVLPLVAAMLAALVIALKGGRLQQTARV